jgi:hypothetical protein
VLVNMAFNMGPDKLGGFKEFRKALEAGDYGRAVKEMLDSDWAWQVGHRALELAWMMRTGRPWDGEKFEDDLLAMARKPLPLYIADKMGGFPRPLR